MRTVDIRSRILYAGREFQTATRKNSCTIVNILAGLPNLLARAKGYVKIVYKGEKIKILLNNNQKKLLFPTFHFGNKDRRINTERFLVAVIQGSIWGTLFFYV